MAHHDETVGRLRRRLTAILFLRKSLQLLTAWVFVWGTAVLVLRAGIGLPREPLLWGLLGVPIALAAALVRALRRVPSDDMLRALLDRQGGCGGLLVASVERPLGPWRDRLPAIELPRVEWRGQNAWGLFAAGVSFVLLCFFLPQRFTQASGSGLDISREAERRARQIEVLKEERLLDPTRAESLKEKLDQTRAEAKGQKPARTLEALDHLKDVLTKAAQAGAESAARKSAEMNKAEAASEALQKAGPAMEEKKLAKAMEEMNDLVKKAAEDNDLLRKKMKEQGLAQEGGDGNAFDPDTLKRLSRALKDSKGDLKNRLERLMKEKLLDPEDLKRCECDGECDADALARLLEQQGNQSLKEMLARCKKPGKGGVTEDGPEPTELTFGDESKADGVKFKEEALPPPALKALKDSKRTGFSLGDPSKDKAVAGGSGALAGAASGGGSANAPVVLPRHRPAVQRYFERPARP